MEEFEEKSAADSVTSHRRTSGVVVPDPATSSTDYEQQCVFTSSGVLPAGSPQRIATAEEEPDQEDTARPSLLAERDALLGAPSDLWNVSGAEKAREIALACVENLATLFVEKMPSPALISPDARSDLPVIVTSGVEGVIGAVPAVLPLLHPGTWKQKDLQMMTAMVFSVVPNVRVAY